MKELAVQKFLRCGGTLEELRKPPYSLIVKEEGSLVLLKYTQGVSDGFNPIVNECRGIVLDRDDNWFAVCHPFYRFYNAGQPEAAKLGNSLNVYEKCDGSLCKVYNYRGEWMCGSNTTIDARNTFIDGRFNFFELVEAALATRGYTWETFTENLLPTYTYMFELICPETRQVVDYGDKRELVYLGDRNNYTLEEYFTPIAGLTYPKIYPLTTMEEIAVAVEELGDNAEGFVVVDENWNRNKVKSSNYFKLHYAANNGRPKVLEMIMSGEDTEFLAYFPQYKEQFDEMRGKMAEISRYAELLRANTSYFWEEKRKGFVAAICVEKAFADFVFKCYENHRLTWSEYVKEWDVNRWKWFFKKVEEE